VPGGIELQRPEIVVLAEVAGPAPIDLRRPVLREQLPTVLDHAPVAWRHPRQRAKLALAAASVAGFRAALDGLGFTEIHTPKLVGSATEGGANLFRLDYFGRTAYLAQSPQLYKQALVGALERVYELGPAFRAEPHETGRHLAEYVSLDAEVGFIEDYRDVLRVAREAVAGMVASIGERAHDASALAGARLPEVPPAIPAIDFAGAQELLER
jgi:nondiscriminating aspartyl-tRNA synthetase